MTTSTDELPRTASDGHPAIAAHRDQAISDEDRSTHFHTKRQTANPVRSRRHDNFQSNNFGLT